MTTAADDLHKYPPLLTLKELAEILRRTPEGLRFTMRGDSELAQALRLARRKIGRRVLFRKVVVASVLALTGNETAPAEGK